MQISDLITRLDNSASFGKLIDALQNHIPVLQISGLWGSGKSYLISALWQKTSRPILIIAPDEETADAVTSDIQFFTGQVGESHRQVLQFPGWEILPYEEIDPLPDLIAERMLVFKEIVGSRQKAVGGKQEIVSSRQYAIGSKEAEAPIVITSIKELTQKVVPQEYLLKQSLTVEFGESYELDRILTQLVNIGYERTPMVEKRGEFAVRGGILDIFDIASVDPVRLEFEGDELASIRYFDLVTQRSKPAPGMEQETELDKVTILPAKETVLISRALEDKVELVTLLDYFDANTIVIFDELLNIKQSLTQFEQLVEERYTAAFSLVEPSQSEIRNPKSEIQVPTPEKLFANLSEIQDLIPPRVTLDLSLLPEPQEDRRMKDDRFARMTDEFSSLVPRPSSVGVSFDLPMQSMESYRGQLDAFVTQLQNWQKNEYTVYIVCDNQGQLERLDELLKSKELVPEKLEPENRRTGEPETFQNRTGEPETTGEPENRRIGEPEIKTSSPTHPFADSPSLPVAPSPIRPFAHSPIRPLVYLTVGALHTGFAIPELKLAVITDREIFSRYTRVRHFRRFHDGVPISSFIELTEGDYLVHEDHGIGKYLGIKKMVIDGQEGDYLQMEYAESDKLYVPVDQIYRVQKYIATEGMVPKLNTLGDRAWERTKQRAKEAIQKMANELLELYGSRQMLPGHAFAPDTIWQREFEASFLFEETPDQFRAINEVKENMELQKPMDRLLCGDVGYGKTEVALRAAFKAVMDKKQVAVLVPTTILAEQHYHTFSERLADYPIVVEMLSRFRSSKQQKDVIARLNQGSVDIVIGTHRLISKDIAFRDLGLLIIDEEQRFGVRHKEKLKQLRTQVDVLTLTATPIPRTLYMSLSGIRDISIINTPPEDRLPILTYIHRFDDKVIREAILRELNRGGQVYFVHNRVQSIDALANYLKKLIPTARIAVGHGQQSEHELERVMLEFIAKHYDILVSTTIIESGLDIPNVNTIIINRADAMGLAQLYQLRGRVGRDRHQAYAYLLVPQDHGLSQISEKRLRTIQEFTELGSGFRIAMRDLEIRGMGNLLGAQQSGHLEAIGFDLYCKMVEETIAQLQGKPMPKRIETRLHLPVPAYFPASFIPDERQKFWIYRKLAEIHSEPELDETINELRDRYGSFPPEAQQLLDLVRLRLFAASLGIEYLAYQDEQLFLRFNDSAAATKLGNQIKAKLGKKVSDFGFRISDLDVNIDLPNIPEDNLIPTITSLLTL